MTGISGPGRTPQRSGAPGARVSRARLAAVGAAIAAAVLLAGIAAAAGPPFPPQPSGQRIVDTAGVFSADVVSNGESILAEVESVTGGQVVVYTQIKPGAEAVIATADAAALLAQWQVGGPTGNGLAMLFDLDTTGRHGQVRLAAGPGFSRWLPASEIQGIVEGSMISLLNDGQVDDALTSGLSRLWFDVQVIAGGGTVNSGPESPGPVASGAAPAATSGSPAPSRSPLPTASPTPRPAIVAPGPPYPPPTTGRRVYDQAGALKPGTIAKLQAASEAIEERTGAQVVVYTQVKPGVDQSDAAADAAALIDQWGIGRKGFDDGARHPVRPRPFPEARPGPALRGPRIRVRLPEQR